MAAVVLFVFATFVSVVFATSGVDVSTSVSAADWACMKQKGYSFGVVRCYESVGQPDPDCPATVENAWNGGMAHVDVYMFPDPSRGNPASQVDEMVSFMESHGLHPRGTPPGSFGMVWLDIEGPQYWGSQGDNQAFFSGLVKELQGHGIVIGVYTSESQWSPIMGDWDGGASFPLWYAHYDGSPSFSDFVPFGGWRTPAIKQWQGTTTVCGAGVDLNWYPDGLGHPVYNSTMAVEF